MKTKLWHIFNQMILFTHLFRSYGEENILFEILLKQHNFYCGYDRLDGSNNACGNQTSMNKPK